MTTSPFLCNNPSTGGLSPARVPRPRLPFNRLRRPLRPALATCAGNPLCPATMYTSSASISPLSWTGFFYPQRLFVIGWSFPAHRQMINPVLLRSVRSKGSIPSDTDTAPRHATVGDVLRKSCRLDRQIVVHRLDIYTVVERLDGYEIHVC